jgi:hypothetical protein
MVGVLKKLFLLVPNGPLHLNMLLKLNSTFILKVVFLHKYIHH